MIEHLIFDWGDTLMRDDPTQKGPMYCWEHIELIEGVREILPILQSDYCLSVGTNAGKSDETMVMKAFDRVGIQKYFSHFFTSITLGYAKPDSGFFNSILKQLQTLPHHCVMIGNSYEKDIVGAHRIGMKTILFNVYQVAGDFPEADEIICRMQDLPEVLPLK